MLRKIIFTTCACILVITSITKADFPAEEAWRVEFDTTATVLGPSWQDDDGQTFFLIGLRNKAVIIGDEEIVWESPELDGWISAVNRIDFGIDGPEIVIATVTPEYGWSHYFTGEDYDNHFESREGRRYETYDPPYVTGGGDNRVITTIDYLQENHPDYERSLIFGGIISNWYSDWPRSYEMVTTTVNDSEVFDIDDDDDNDVIYGRSFSESGFSQYGGYNEFSRFRCELVAYNKDSDLIWDFELARDEFDEENANPNVRLLRLQFVEYSNDALLAISFRRRAHYYLAVMSLDELEMVDVSVTSGIEWMSAYYGTINNQPRTFLVCVDHSGSIFGYSLSEYEVFDVSDNFVDNCKGIEISNFDDDEDLEMAVLTADAFIMYDLGRLSAPSTSEPPWIPERCEIVRAYPNPFNSLTRIEYSVPQPGLVALTVHDLTGREIIRLADGWQSAGNYNLILDAFNLSSGVYLIRLDAGVMRDARRVMLLK